MTDGHAPTWRNLRLGVFFLLSTTALVGFLLVVGTNQRIFTRSYSLKLHLTNAQGISEGAVVSLSGLEVGRVSEIRFIHSDSTQVLEVTMEVERKYRPRITQDSAVTIRTVGVLGDKFIDISLGDPGLPPLPDGAVLPVTGQIDWTATFERVVDNMDDFETLLARSNQLLETINRGEGTLGLLISDPETANRLRRMVDDLAAVAGSLHGGRGAAGRLVSDPETARRMDAILNRLDHVTAQADSGRGPLGRLLSDEDMGLRLERLIAGSDSLIAAIRTGGTTGRLIEDDRLYRDMTETLTELRTLLEDLRQNPRKYMKLSVF
jgi:phospholipid/cholesterol/gamma-HCH transport system substrate-binding protein